MNKKTSLFKAIGGGLLLLILGALLSLIGCTVKSESQVMGEYQLDGVGKIVLSISPDKTFSETIFWPSGKIEKRSGKWQWHPSGLSFDQLWIPSEFVPDYIRQADAYSKNQPKFTEPGHWVMAPEKHWGTITLPIFPDAEVSFKMIRRFSK